MRRFIWKGFLAFPVLVGIGFLLFHTQGVSSQSFGGARDPGVRGGPAGAGGPLSRIVGTRRWRISRRARRSSMKRKEKASRKAWDRG